MQFTSRFRALCGPTWRRWCERPGAVRPNDSKREQTSSERGALVVARGHAAAHAASMDRSAAMEADDATDDVDW